MKTHIAIIWFIAIVYLSGCQKPTEELQEAPSIWPKQLIFENVQRCCPQDTCKDLIRSAYSLKNITAKLINYGSTKVIYADVKTDTLWTFQFPEKDLPLWKYHAGDLQICNMPDELKYAKKDFNVKFDCIILYVPPPRLGLSIPSWPGYPVELTRIEILKDKE